MKHLTESVILPSGLVIRSAPQERTSDDEIITSGKFLYCLEFLNSFISHHDSSQLLADPLELRSGCLALFQKPLECIDKCGIARRVGLCVLNGHCLTGPRCRGHADKKTPASAVSAEEEIVTVVNKHDRSKDIKLDGWWIRPEERIAKKYAGDKLPTIIVFHGLADICFRDETDFLCLLRRTVPANIFVASYRGFGNNYKADEKTLREDSMAFLEHVRKKREVDPNKIFLLGRSMGGNLASYVAANTKHPIKGIMLENTFASWADQVAKVSKGLFTSRGLEKNNATLGMDAKRDLKALRKNIPVYIMKAEYDRAVNPNDSDRLLSLSKNATMVSFKCSHLGAPSYDAKPYGWYIRNFVTNAEEFVRNTPNYVEKKFGRKMSNLYNTRFVKPVMSFL